MDDMTPPDEHTGLYTQLSQVATNVAEIKKDIGYINEKLTKQNGRVEKAEVRLDLLEKVNQQLLFEVKKFNTNEAGREKARKSLRSWVIDNISAVLVAILIGYLMLKFGF